jgi:P27 family predicted phage terminase small subunit
MRGRKPTPTALKLLHGNPGKRGLPKHEPKPPLVEGSLPAPRHLSRDAAAEWRRMLPLLRSMRVLTDADLVMVAALCSLVGDFAMAERHLRREGLVIVGRDGNEVRSPWLFVKTKAIEQIIRISTEFGLTPASRTRIVGSAAAPKADDPGNSFDEYLAERPED